MHELGDDRQQALEEKLAFTERHVEELDGLVRELFEKCAHLEKSIERLRDETNQRFDEGDDDQGPEDHVPPHWGRKS